MLKPVLSIAAIVFVSTALCSDAQAQLFKNVQQRRTNTFIQKGQASLDYQPLTRFGQSIKSRQDAKLRQTAARTGQSAAELRGKRMHRLEMLGAAMGGLGDGLSASASSFSYTSPTTSSFNSSRTLPSNFSQRTQMNSFNRNYSTTPYYGGASDPKFFNAR